MRRADITDGAKGLAPAGLPDLLHIVLLACAERAQVAKRPRTGLRIGLGGGKLRHLAGIVFSFIEPAAPPIYTLSLHDALPISRRVVATNAGIAVQPVDVGVLDPRDR